MAEPSRATINLNAFMVRGSLLAGRQRAVVMRFAIGLAVLGLIFLLLSIVWAPLFGP